MGIIQKLAYFFVLLQNRFCIMMEQDKKIYSEAVVEFVTVSAEYCKRLETCQEFGQDDFIDVFCKVLPLLYLKASLLVGHVSDEEEGFVEHPVTENDYNYVRNCVADLLMDKDDYLDVFVEDFKYSDRPIRQTISENLADVYQNLRNFIEVYRQGYDDAMLQALSEVVVTFELEWGQKLLNALRALHDVKYGAYNQMG